MSAIALAQIVNQDYRSIERNKVSSIESIETIEANKVIESVSDLIDDPKYLPFFFKRYYAIGKERFLESAYKARKYGRNPSTLFVHLLK